MKRSSSSSRWLKEHFSDTYVIKAKREGLRGRSVYKLSEINERYKIIKPNMKIVDLGASPGGWSEYIAKIVGQKGAIIALDILPMKPILGVECIQGDFTNEEVVASLYSKLGDKKVDLVLSDMAPNISGVKFADQMKAMDLADKALAFSQRVLKNNGTFLIKTFQGAGFEEFLKIIGRSFSEIKVVKPDASRMRSSEVFILARGYKPQS